MFAESKQPTRPPCRCCNAKRTAVGQVSPGRTMTIQEDRDRVLLAVDLGVRTGLALFNRCGKLKWYRSQNFGRTERLRRAIPGILGALPPRSLLVLEGGGDIAGLWEKEGARRDLVVSRVQAEEWRSIIVPVRFRQSGPFAKNAALSLARQVIEWSGAKRPTSLRHDAAEAILTGLWGVWHAGWLKTLPPGLDQG